MQLGLENKKEARWAIILGVVALIVCAYELIPMFMGPSTPSSSAEAAAPSLARPTPTRPGPKGSSKAAQKPREESLDPTLKLDLLATSEKTQYEGAGRNIFVSQREEVHIEAPIAPPNTDIKADVYRQPTIPVAPAIPLKFYGFANSPGEPKKVFLKNGDDVFVAGEGEIVDRRYKVIRITATSVEIQDMVYSGPPQNIPLTQG